MFVRRELDRAGIFFGGQRRRAEELIGSDHPSDGEQGYEQRNRDHDAGSSVLRVRPLAASLKLRTHQEKVPIPQFVPGNFIPEIVNKPFRPRD